MNTFLQKALELNESIFNLSIWIYHMKDNILNQEKLKNSLLQQYEIMKKDF